MTLRFDERDMFPVHTANYFETTDFPPRLLQNTDCRERITTLNLRHKLLSALDTFSRYLFGKLALPFSRKVEVVRTCPRFRLQNRAHQCYPLMYRRGIHPHAICGFDHFADRTGERWLFMFRDSGNRS